VRVGATLQSGLRQLAQIRVASHNLVLKYRFPVRPGSAYAWEVLRAQERLVDRSRLGGTRINYIFTIRDLLQREFDYEINTLSSEYARIEATLAEPLAESYKDSGDGVSVGKTFMISLRYPSALSSSSSSIRGF
jgi:hypothetical protein